MVVYKYLCQSQFFMQPQSQRKMNRIAQVVHGCSQSVQNTKILIVGVGGIGCQILKVICKMPLAAIHILDMDTIEITNLNRQFLFKREHKGMSKSLVAKDVILELNPSLKIEAHHKNIKELQISFFKEFNFIIMALDNIDARNYVNRIGVRLQIPIIDAGTMAYKGNVSTIIAGKSRCYACEPKSTSQKQYPVCTIRSRPQKPIHCIVWAKLLFQVMFGGNTDNDMNDLQILSQKPQQQILTKLFQKDIQNIKTSKQDLDKNKLTEAYLKRIKMVPSEMIASCIDTKLLNNFNMFNQVLEIQRHISIFSQSCRKLKEQKQKLGAVVFQKDDDDVIHFISSAANLRMHCFSIELQSFDQVKNMAGNIVPAIASTNSIVSGIQIIELLKYLRNEQNMMKSYFIQNQHAKIFALKMQKPLQSCTICSQKAIPVFMQCPFSNTTVQDIITIINEKSPNLSQFSINKGSTQIYNSQEPVQIILKKTISQISQTYEIDLILTNEDTMEQICTIWLINNNQIQEITTTHPQKLIPIEKMNVEASNNHEQKGAVNDDDESDVVIFGDEPSPQIQIVEVVHKRQKVAGQQMTEYEQIKKKIKAD